MTVAGSRRVASWVAGCREVIWLTHAVLAEMGSKCSNFFDELRTCERRGRKRIEQTIGTTCYTCYPNTYVFAGVLEALDVERGEAA